MYEKTVVSGPDASALYGQLARAARDAPRWNFHKYLLGRDGSLLASYPSKVAPDDPGLVAALEKALEKP
jgi:glutathione peroxidase